MKKRIMSFALAQVMVCGLLPVAGVRAQTAEITEIESTEMIAEELIETTAAAREQAIFVEGEVLQKTPETIGNSQETAVAQWKYEFYGEGIVLTAYIGTAADVYIPSKVDGHTVVKLCDRLFYDNDGLNSVTLGTGILEIGEQAFFDCDNLVCVLISEELTTIGAEAFYSCDVFNSLILYDVLSAIGENTFDECPSLTVWCNEATPKHNVMRSGLWSRHILLCGSGM